MSYTLLLDLDDTLLANPLSDFLPAYLGAISNHLAPYTDPQQVIEMLLVGTQQMIQNQRPDCTLKDVFDGVFYSPLGLVESDLRPIFGQFYENIYPSLKKHTHSKPEAIRFVEQAFELGHRVAIATNPLFPYTAIVQRLSWAGLPPEKYPFALIPSYETFHFAKPNPAYLAEILAQLGWPEGPVLMVGDDLENDISTANNLGISSYLISEAENPSAGSLPTPAKLKPAEAGNFSQLQEWLNRISKDLLEPNFNSPPAMLAILRSTPAALSNMCQELPLADWTKRPWSDEWCQTEILCHLRDVEAEVNLPRLRQFLQDTNPFLTGMDTDPWVDQRKYIHQDGPSALQQFITSRMQTLNILEDLSPADWNTTARHSIFGPTDLTEIVSIMTGHDRLHIRQVYDVIHNSS